MSLPILQWYVRTSKCVRRVPVLMLVILRVSVYNCNQCETGDQLNVPVPSLVLYSGPVGFATLWFIELLID